MELEKLLNYSQKLYFFYAFAVLNKQSGYSTLRFFLKNILYLYTTYYIICKKCCDRSILW